MVVPIFANNNSNSLLTGLIIVRGELTDTLIISKESVHVILMFCF